MFKLETAKLERYITKAEITKNLAEDIITFLSQIENFKKDLWERKRRVIEVEYVITLNKIEKYAGKDFLNEVIDCILKNKEQLSEWEKLGFGRIGGKNDLLLQKTLPLDTRYFSTNFKEKLIGKLTQGYNLDDILDGLLIKSENWQALNFLLDKYRGKVQTIYIDPPFNKKQDADYLYSVKYEDSTWA
ncbi:MAG: site-specific DNA-methyltransferase, partial [Candidatus Aenigmatarchaeota archaeon]